MKKGGFKSKIIAAVLSICIIVAAIPTAFATADTINANSNSIQSADDLYSVIGGSEVAELNGDEVKLDCDVYLKDELRVCSGNININLNGHDIINDGTNNVITLLSGNLKIADDTNIGSIRGSKYAVNIMGGNLTVDAGRLNSVYANGGNLIMNGGKIYEDSKTALAITDGSVVVINGGEITAKGTAVQLGEMYYGENVSLTINDGAFYSQEMDAITAMYGNLTVNGGNIKARGHGFYPESYAGITAYSDTVVEINGGNISGGYTGLNLFTSKASISKGSFNGYQNAIVSNRAIANSIKEGSRVLDKDGNEISDINVKTLLGKVEVVK